MPGRGSLGKPPPGNPGGGRKPGGNPCGIPCIMPTPTGQREKKIIGDYELKDANTPSNNSTLPIALDINPALQPVPSHCGKFVSMYSIQ